MILISKVVEELKDKSVVVDVLFDKKELIEWLNSRLH